MLEPIAPPHADALFPLVYGTSVTDTIVWEGPSSLEELRASFARERDASSPLFAITLERAAVGVIDLRPVRGDYRVGTGLWIGLPFQGRGLGTRALGEIAALAFARGAEKLEANVFIGNTGSRRALEKNGFLLEGTIRRAVRKRGVLIDEWLFGLTPADPR